MAELAVRKLGPFYGFIGVKPFILRQKMLTNGFCARLTASYAGINK
jgi:hypothetical protein